MKTAISYAGTLAAIAAIAVGSHYLIGIDWPWAVVVGAVAFVLVRALIQTALSRSTCRRPSW